MFVIFYYNFLFLKIGGMGANFARGLTHPLPNHSWKHLMQRVGAPLQARQSLDKHQPLQVT